MIKKIYSSVPDGLKMTILLATAFGTFYAFMSKEFKDPILANTIKSHTNQVEFSAFKENYDEHKVLQTVKDSKISDSISALDTKVDDLGIELQKDLRSSENRIIDKILELKN